MANETNAYSLAGVINSTYLATQLPPGAVVIIDGPVGGAMYYITTDIANVPDLNAVMEASGWMPAGVVAGGAADIPSAPMDYGSLSSAPTNPSPTAGACYFDTTLALQRVYNGTTWDSLIITPLSMGGLTDADTTTVVPVINDLLGFDGSAWVPQTPASSPIYAIDDLTDVDTTTSPPISGWHLEYDGAKWVGSAPDALNIDDLSDVNTSTTSPGIGDFLNWNGGQWVPLTLDIDRNSDVDTTTVSPVVGDHFQFDGSNWVPRAPKYEDFDEITTYREVNATSAVQVHSWSVNCPNTGVYRIDWMYIWSLDSTSRDFRARVQVDDTTNLLVPEHREEPQDSKGTGAGDTDQRHYNHGYRYVTLTAGNHTIDIDVYTSHSKAEAGVHFTSIAIREM